jgi:hypothetical protein
VKCETCSGVLKRGNRWRGGKGRDGKKSGGTGGRAGDEKREMQRDTPAATIASITISDSNTIESQKYMIFIF